MEKYGYVHDKICKSMYGIPQAKKSKIISSPKILHHMDITHIVTHMAFGIMSGINSPSP